MDPRVRQRAESFWAERLACPVELLRTRGVHVRARPDANALFAVAIDSSTVVVAPRDLHDSLAALPAGDLVEPRALAGVVPRRSRFVGPAFVGYAESFPPPAPGVERVGGAGSSILSGLRAAVTDEEWRHANLAAKGAIFTIAVDGAVVAACGFEPLAGRVAHLGVVTHPSHRGRGLARSVVSAAAAEACAAGLLPQYQTLVANLAAMKVGEVLGFARFATTLAVRWD